MKEEKLAGNSSREESLDEYIRVAGPGTLVVVLSLLLLFVGLLVWGFVGKLPVTDTVTGLVMDYDNMALMMMDEKDYKDYELDSYEVDPSKIRVVCFIDAADYSQEEIKEFGNNVVIRTPNHKKVGGRLDVVSDYPLSKETAGVILSGSDWIIEKCFTGDYCYLVEIIPDEDMTAHDFKLAEITFTTEEISPIQVLFR